MKVLLNNGKTVMVEKIVYRNYQGKLICLPVEDIKKILDGNRDKEFNPIKITEDLLLKLGFQKEVDKISRKGFYMYLPNGFRIDINKYSNTIGRDYGIHIDNLSCDSVLRGDIQYLHQLQNYIYDATGEELDVKELFK